MNINLSDYDKRTVGHLAACGNHYKILAFLSQKTDFNFNCKDRFGKTTLDEIKD